MTINCYKGNDTEFGIIQDHRWGSVRMWRALELQFSQLNLVLLRILVVAGRFIILYYSWLYSPGSLRPCRCQQLSFVVGIFSLEDIFRSVGDIWGPVVFSFLTLIICWTGYFSVKWGKAGTLGSTHPLWSCHTVLEITPLSSMLGHGQPGGEGENPCCQPSSWFSLL